MNNRIFANTVVGLFFFVSLISCASSNRLNLEVGQPEVTMSESVLPDAEKYEWLYEAQISKSNYNAQASRDLAMRELAELSKQKGAQFVKIYFVDTSRDQAFFWTKFTTVIKANLYRQKL